MIFVVTLLLILARQAVSELTSKDKQLLLDLHNGARRDVFPTAANMEEMEWNDVLAQVAQAYSEKCIFAHNVNRTKEQTLFQYVGENITITTNPVNNYASLFTSWVNEENFYDFINNKCSGHYTQVVWATSNNFGCGATRCPAVKNFYKDREALILVCNYGPGGNYIGQHPYTSGTPCSNCPSSKPFCSENLCTDTDDSKTYGLQFFSPLANGDNMCFSIHGKPKLVYSLIRDKYIQLNGQFVLPVDEMSYTIGNVPISLGEFGLIIKNQETSNVTVVKVSAVDRSILVGNSLIVVKDKPINVDIFYKIAIDVDPNVQTVDPHHVQTAKKKNESAWLNINTDGFGMKVRFYKNYLEMFLTKTNGLTNAAHGLIGQFLTADVKIDTKNMLMQLGDHKPMAVKKGTAWPFLDIKGECWHGTATDIDKGGEIVDGIYTDYIVDQLIPN